MAVPTNISEALALLTADGSNKITGTDVREVVTWLASLGPTPAYQSQATWYIDPTSGDDEADGLTSGTALATQAEWLRRTGGEPTVAMTITFLSDSTEDMAWHLTNTPETVVTVTGTVTSLYSGTATSATTWSSGSLRDGKITDTAAPSTWTAAGLVGKLGTITSGVLTGFKFWVWKDLEPTLSTRTYRTTRVTHPTTGEVRADFTAGTSYTISDIVTLSGGHDIRGYVTFDSVELGDEAGAAHQHRVSSGSPTFTSCKLHGLDFHGASHPAMRACWFSKGLDGGLYDNSIVTTQGMHFADGLTVRHAAQLHAFSTTSAAKFVLTDYAHVRIVTGGTCAWYECENGLELGPLTSINASAARIWGVDVTGIGLSIGASARVVLGAGFPVSIGAATVTTQVSIGGVALTYAALPHASPGDPTPYSSPTNLATITLDL